MRFTPFVVWFLLLNILIIGCTQKYAKYEIPETYPGFENIAVDDSCQDFCINNAPGRVIMKNSVLYCKCLIPTGI